jgi:hypothetical protein
MIPDVSYSGGLIMFTCGLKKIKNNWRIIKKGSSEY